MPVPPAELIAIVSFAVVVASVPLWLPWLLDAYTLAFLGDALFRMMCF